MKIKSRILGTLFSGNVILKKIFWLYINRIEGGVFYSESIREVFSQKYKIQIGKFSYGCFNPKLNYGLPIEIGNFCSFAEDVQFIPDNHPIYDISTHPFFHRSEYGFVSTNSTSIPTMIVGSDVWIGRNVTILPGCKRIGNGAIIGACSVVTHDVPEYSIVAGNPAKILRYRFSERDRKMISASKWFETDLDHLKTCIKYSKDFSTFISKINDGKQRS